ncbi:MAG: hypothetical protein ACQETJ_02195 [Bacteroidota bacterium]
MKNTKFNTIKIAVVIFVFAIFAGCSDYLDNPLKDEETGEDINLLVLDFNFFNTRMTYKLFDATNGELITSTATISFSGENGNDIVTYSGEKKPEYVSELGQLELTVDPNVIISESSPFKFAVNVEAEGYNNLTKAFQLKNEGKKTFELYLSKTGDEDESEIGGDIDYGEGDTTIVFSKVVSDGLKSAAEEKPYKIQYGISLNDLARFRDTNGDSFFSSSSEAEEAYLDDPDNFMSISLKSFSDYSPEIDVVNIDGIPTSVLFHKLETGRIEKITLVGREVGDLNGGLVKLISEYTGEPEPDIFGFAVFSDVWDIIGTQSVYNSLDISYTLVKASAENLCDTGSKITFQSDVISSFSIDADVYDMYDNLLTTINFKGNFPEEFTVENTPGQAVKLVFRDNNPAFKTIPVLEIDNFCSGSYTVNVEPQENYEEYQIVLKAFCPDSPGIAVAPTYSGEFKIKDSDNPWQGVDMAGGVVDLLGLPGQEYELRLLWEDEWEYSTLFTEFANDGSYLNESGSDISSELMDDSRVRIRIDHNFSQNVCDDMNW